ncbi:MAG: hypothetical protein KDJ97_38795, partial [Anaerolineae bacterium]|nr:hypothetical protein [Anaerolineae bacterium]
GPTPVRSREQSLTGIAGWGRGTNPHRSFSHRSAATCTDDPLARAKSVHSPFFIPQVCLWVLSSY